MKRLDIVLGATSLVLILALSYLHLKPRKTEEPETDSIVKVVELADKYANAYKCKVDSGRINEQLLLGLEEQKLKLANQNKLIIALLQELMPLIPEKNEAKKQQVLKKYGVGIDESK